ncbi:MAG: hypothetical protein GY749_49115 [Desulfobacteraceae bacterium]|nr:hypothetical protein [Desulfobacteraceae bacterium]
MIYFFNCIRIAIYIWGMLVAIYGFGLFINQLTNYYNNNYAINLTIGLGCLIFLGGVFNLLNIAYGWIFDILFLVGIVIFIQKSKNVQFNLQKNKSELFHFILVALVIFVIMFFTIATQLPPDAYNYHDDFEKYFAHPVRMLQTGTLFGSPLSAIGSETLGGQAVLHGIILNHFPIYYINGVDAVFGLFICLILSISIGVQHIKFIPISLISLLTVFFINPQYVNVSAYYTAIAFMMTAILLSCDCNLYKCNKKNNLAPPPIMIGLTYATLIALKSIFILFPVIHFIFYVIGLKLFRANICRLLHWGMRTIIFTLLFLSPWILLHFPNYIRSSSKFHNDSILTYVKIPELFSWEPLYYGSSFAHYTFTCIAIVLLACMFILLKINEIRSSINNNLPGIFSISITVITSYLLILSISPMLNGYTTNLRYTIPYLIAATPIIFTLVGYLAISDNFFINKSIFTVLLSIGILILVAFSNSLSDRIRQAFNYGSILAFTDLATEPDFLAYNKHVLYGDAKPYINSIQKQVPADAEIVAWISTPFYLNYKRNTIYDAEPAGIASPWAYVPNAEYFIYEYHGFAVRTSKYLNKMQQYYPGRHERQIAKSCIEFIQLLHNLKQNSDEIYNDGRIIVFKKHDQ